MFRNRNTTQKPTDELVANFKTSYPHLRTSESSEQSGIVATSSAGNSPGHASTARSEPDHEHNDKELEPISRSGPDEWRLTPSLLDPTSFSFSQFANQPPGYYTPTPGGTNTYYHTQAGDLHTPHFGLGVGTPLSMPTSESTFPTSHVAHAPITSFHHAALPPQIFQNIDPFSYQHHSPNHHHATHPHHHSIDLGRPIQFHSHQHVEQSPISFPPHDFSHTGFESFDRHHGDTRTMDHSSLQMSHIHDPHHQSPVVAGPPMSEHDMSPVRSRRVNTMPVPSQRYFVTLNAPTAMTKTAEEIPVTYLNKGQAYTIAVTDTQANSFVTLTGQYRTYVRISFEDEQQRAKPAACWQLWKEGRGINEAHHRGGRLQAVEYVEPGQTSASDASGKPQLELEYTSFDGFSVLWTPARNGPVECAINVRFNFLSTDFSHSKGVKGIPVRLCAKTELKSSAVDGNQDGVQSEVSYCKVKLFRDHGAERKLANDNAHVRKSIEKVKSQIAQAESGVKDSGKRKRSNSISKSQSSHPRPAKVARTKRTWSMSSEASLSGGPRGSAEDNLHDKLQALQDMFSSNRPSSVLNLVGDALDDPDLHPVQLTGGPPELLKVETGESSNLSRNSSASNISPTPSSVSMQPTSERRQSEHPRSTFNPPSRMTSDEWQNISHSAAGDIPSTVEGGFVAPTAVTRIRRRTTVGSQGSWIDATGVDPSYQPPDEKLVKPVACFFFKVTAHPRQAPGIHPPDLHRAIYLMQRTLTELVHHIATKSEVSPVMILRTIRVNRKGIEILVDDEMVAELPEGQDMTVEFSEIVMEEPVKQEAQSSNLPEVLVEGDIDSAQITSIKGYTMRLHF